MTTPTRGSLILLVLVFAGIFLVVSLALVNYMLSSNRLESQVVTKTKAITLAEGALDRAAAKLNLNPSYAGETNTPLGDGVYTITVSNIDSQTKRITATASIPDAVHPVIKKTATANIGLADVNVSFHYGIQSGAGGFILENSSSITGNVYSGGSIIGTSQNEIRGNVVAAGPTGLVYGIRAVNGSVYAHTIGGAAATIVDKDAYYVTKTNTTVGGTSYPGSPDQPIEPLPISDAQITDWENQAAAGGSVTCTGSTYQISSGTVTLGPKKIPCDLVVSNSATLVVSGHLWVTGNISFQNSSVTKMAPSLGGTNVAIIADKPTDRINSSTISVKNSSSFQNSGSAGSFVFLVSQNSSAEQGGSVPAINIKNSASAMVVYAAHGYIPLANSITLKEATAYKIGLKNSASVSYDTGLPHTIFDTGPGGGWSFIPETYATH
jgi:hypothetical protein